LAFLVGGEISSTIEHAAAEHGHPEAKAEGQKAALRLIRSGCEISMAHLGILCRVGTPAPETGRYQHSACGETRPIKEKEIIQLCGNVDCPHKGAQYAKT